MKIHQNSVFKILSKSPDLKGPFWAAVLISLAYLFGNIVLFESMYALVKSAANPFFAVLIVVTTVLGQVLAISLIYKLLKEALFISDYKTTLIRPQSEASGEDNDMFWPRLGVQYKKLASFELYYNLYKLKMSGKSIDRSLLNGHLKVYEDKVSRRSAIAQHIANSLIGLGLFGTFLGLIVTLKEVAGLIGVFAVDGNVDSGSLMGQFFQNMSGPLAGMGEAFVASLLGLGGSMINGLQMIYVKKLQHSVQNLIEHEYFDYAEKIGVSIDMLEEVNNNFDGSTLKHQLGEISGLRSDVKKQTDAILISASKMRLASDAMIKTLEVLDRIANQEGGRPNLNRLTAVVEQKLDVMVEKLSNAQQVHGQILLSMDESGNSLKDISQKTTQLLSQANNGYAKLTSFYQHVVDADARSESMGQESVQTLKELIHANLAYISSILSECVRVAREHSNSLGDINSQAKHANLQLVDIEETVKKMFESIQPQVVEMIARLEKSEQNMNAISKYDWAHLHNKFEELQVAIKADRSLESN